MNAVASLLSILLLLIPSTRAEDAFFDIPLSEVKFDSALPTPPESDWQDWQKRQAMSPRVVVLDGEGFISSSDDNRFAMTPADLSPGAHLVVRAPADKEVTGTLYLAKPDLSGMMPLHFTLAATEAKPDAKPAYLHALISYCDNQLNSNRAGAAYFRYRADEAVKELGEKAGNDDTRFRPARVTELESTLDLFTGSRAIAENLQLDRSLTAPEPGEPSIDINTIPGINVAPMDFKAMIKDATPQLDPLARYVPGDQHAVFFPSFAEFSRVMSESNKLGDTVFTTIDTRGEDAGVRARYEKQLGLELSVLSKILGPTMVSSVAVTGGDLYFATGTDVAILFESKEPAVLRGLLQGKLVAGNSMPPKLENIDGIDCAVFRDESNGIRSYVATLDNAVLVTNSPAQVKAIAAAKASEDASLLKSPEYVYFRTRYARGDADESAFVVLTDATIRRWCSAKWRIGDSRRVRALSGLLDLNCAAADLIVSGKLIKASIPGTYPEDPFLGAVQPSSDGIGSSKYGSMHFLTPISELNLTTVTQKEKEAYENWRRQYQSYWRGMFDPIAAKLTVNDKKMAVDLSVMPLIVGTDYRQFIDLTQGVKIAADSGDVHDSVLHYIVAINSKSGLMRSANTFAMGFFPKAGVDPLGWIGPTISLYADDDPFWKELGDQKEKGVEEFLKQRGYAFPAALFIESNSALKLAGFVAAGRAFVEQSAPNMTTWETRQHGDLAYVRVSASEQAKADMRDVDNVSLFYATTGKGLVLSLNEDIIVRALDRLTGNATTRPTTQPATQPWQGESMALQMKSSWLQAFEGMMHESYSKELQQRTWNSLSILNEWKRLYPGKDPMAVHEMIFGATITHPGKGTYTWNEQLQTMQSSVFGHPGEPKMVEVSPKILEYLGDVNAGVTFEKQGLRGKFEISRELSRQ